MQGNEVKPEELIQKSEEMEKSGKLSALPSVQKDFNMAKEFIKNLFAKHHLETSVFRLTEVYNYYVTPAQEANGLRNPKKLAIRFALRRKGNSEWKDLPTIHRIFIGGIALFFYQPDNQRVDDTVFIDMSTWNGNRSASFSSNSYAEKIDKYLTSYQENSKK